ncbi:hypothetical protein BSKO_10797 [Bryopsis sp. KO-2023]|nr:hypothetical protein BSKO_10797 [Bryopsis sp. KO-2023]
MSRILSRLIALLVKLRPRRVAATSSRLHETQWPRDLKKTRSKRIKSHKAWTRSARPFQVPESPLKVLTRKQVHFKEGPFKKKYGTPDGHPVQCGKKPQILPGVGYQKRISKNISAIKIKEMEALLDGTCEPSLKRLRRRAGLSPLRGPYLKYLTGKKKQGAG